MKPEHILVDVVTLSQQHCNHAIQGDLKYCTKENFVGRPLAGYHPEARDICLLIRKAAEQLCVAQNDLNALGYGLVIHEAYRPACALKDMKAWSTQPPADNHELEKKQQHYPHIEKNKMFELGYIAEDSRHCYGEAVDVMLISLKTREFLDMGARYDFMDPLSHVTCTAKDIGEIAFQHRQILSTAMLQVGFETYPEEFWHFNYGRLEDRMITGPMDLPITPDLKGLGVV